MGKTNNNYNHNTNTMMKTSIAVCALLNMMGSNAVSLLARDAIECPSVDAPQSLAQVATTTGPYSPSAM